MKFRERLSDAKREFHLMDETAARSPALPPQTIWGSMGKIRLVPFGSGIASMIRMFDQVICIRSGILKGGLR